MIEPMGDGSIAVTVLVGTERFETMLHWDTLWQDLDQFQGKKTRKNKLKAWTRDGMVWASLIMMQASVAQDARRVCLAACWILFRRPLEMHQDYEAAKMLHETVEEYGAARIVILADEIASLDSFLLQIAPPTVTDDDAALEMTPRTLGPSIYDLQI